MEKATSKKIVAAATIVGAVVLVFGALTLFSGPDDGIEFDTDYALGYSYLAKTGECTEAEADARVFDFADRGLPEPSKLVPLRDSRGIPLVRRDDSLPAGTVRKVQVRVPGRTIEGTAYPAYEVVEWRFNMGVSERQAHIPCLKPR